MLLRVGFEKAMQVLVLVGRDMQSDYLNCRLRKKVPIRLKEHLIQKGYLL
jgi:hypothetical protein